MTYDRIGMMHKEYLRRNLVHAGSVGVRAGIEAVLARFYKNKRKPMWAVAQLESLIARADRSSTELAKWRNAAPDAPQ